MTSERADEPIPGPKPAGPEYIFEPDPESALSPAAKLGRKFADLVREPAHWIRENIVEPNRGPKYYWYHRKYKRAPPIDECYLDDDVCIYEATVEFRRVMLVDRAVLDLLRFRRDSCNFWNLTTKNQHFKSENCREISETFQREENNFFIKYGDMQYNSSVMHFYNKQKHRMIMERRRAQRAQQGDLPEGQTA